MKVLIVGGGMAGLTLAGLLKKDPDFEVTLIDRTSKFDHMGYGLAFWKNGLRVLEHMGIDEDLIKDAYVIPSVDMVAESGRVLNHFNFSYFKENRPVAIERGSLYHLLISNIGDTKVLMSTTVGSVHDKENAVEVQFSDGRVETFDLVVGADGINSSVRRLVFGEGYKSSYGIGITSFWIKKSIKSSGKARVIIGNGRAGLVYPLKDRIMGITLTSIDSTQRSKDISNPKKALAKVLEYENDVIEGSEFEPMVRHVDESGGLFRGQLEYVNMNSFVKGRVVLMGDAAHAHSPFWGMGASLAMEDAVTLFQEIKAFGASGIPEALERYDKRRLARLEIFKKVSKIDHRGLRAANGESLKRRIMVFLIAIFPFRAVLRHVKKFVKESEDMYISQAV